MERQQSVFKLLVIDIKGEVDFTVLLKSHLCNLGFNVCFYLHLLLKGSFSIPLCLHIWELLKPCIYYIHYFQYQHLS